MRKYYAVCDANGPVSVDLHATTTEDAMAAFADLDQAACIGDLVRLELEDYLGICGEGMSAEAFATTLISRGCVAVPGLDPIHDGWTLWTCP